MTALTEFQRLEAQGSWRETPDARLREVIVSVGDATLVLSDPKSERPLSHWSLPAVVRLNPGKMPAIYAPGADSGDETVEIDDPLMIQSIERVHRAIETHRAHPGRLRGGLTLLAVLAMFTALIVWLPDAIIRHAAHIAPPAQSRDMGLALMADMEKSTGAVCLRNSGQTVLDWLAPKLLSDQAVIHVLPSPIGGARRLPGEVYVLGLDLLQGEPGPEAAAAHLIAASLAVDDATLRQSVLEKSGLVVSLRLMTLGHLPRDAVAGQAEAVLAAPAPRPADADLLAALAARNVPAAPYARSIDPTGQAVLPLLENDPFRNAPPARPLLTDEQWLALQQICAG